MTSDADFLQRCFQLASLGAGHVSPNPMVGAVLVHEGKIIGEGWHQQYGQAHAEVNCIRSVSPLNRHLIPEATLYCSLEPCFHIGKTPPCVDLILAEKIRRVVVSNTDPNPKVAGQSFAKLRAAGVKVVTGLLETEGAQINRAFFTWITQKRPYIILKWAQSRDGFMSRTGEQTAISGLETKRLVHRWRSEADAILVGTNTAVIDNPRLDVRYYHGPAPMRIVIDRLGKIPDTHHVLDDSLPTWIFGAARPGNFEHTEFVGISADKDLINNILVKLHAAGKAILFVEGGAQTLRQFLATGYYDEIRILESQQYLKDGIAAPEIPANVQIKTTFQLANDTIRIFQTKPR